MQISEIELSQSIITQINKCTIDNKYRVCSYDCDNCKLNRSKLKYYEEYKNSKWEGNAMGTSKIIEEKKEKLKELLKELDKVRVKDGNK